MLLIAFAAGSELLKLLQTSKCNVAGTLNEATLQLLFHAASAEHARMTMTGLNESHFFFFFSFDFLFDCLVWWSGLPCMFVE